MIEDGESSERGGEGTAFVLVLVVSSRPLVLGRLGDLLLRLDALLLLAFELFPLEEVGSSEPSWYSEELVRET